MLNYLPIPKYLLLQWHITNRCNKRCSHCYQDEYSGDELDKEDLFNILDQYIDLLNKFNARGYINITGGEPFIRKDLFLLLKKIHENKHKLDYGLMTNGSFITEETVKKLKTFEVGNVQLSIEGTTKTNDIIRGKGSFEEIINAAKILVHEGIRTTFSFTSHKQNYDEFKHVVRLGEEIGVDEIWTDRLIPGGSATKMKNQMLEPSELKTYYENIKCISSNLIKKNNKTKISLNRSLFFLVDGPYYACSAGINLITIMPNGDVFPCRRLPIIAGNLKKQTLFEIYYSSDFLWELRNQNKASNTCRWCKNFNICRGGEKCVSYHYYENPFIVDPQCWIAFEKLPSKKITKNEVSKTGFLLDDRLISKNDEVLSIEPYLYEKADKLYYKTRSEEYLISKNQLIRIDLSKDLKDLAYKIIKQNPEIILLSFDLKEEDFNKKTGYKILNFLNQLKSKNVKFKIIKPIPQCLFVSRYDAIIKEYDIPKTCRQCLNLFIVKNGGLYFCNGKKGPKLAYMNNKNQIYEYFKNLNIEVNKLKKCKKCIYNIRKQCVPLCKNS